MYKIIQEDETVHPAFVRLAQLHGLPLDRSLPAEDVSELVQKRWYDKGAITFGGKDRKPRKVEMNLLRELGVLREITAPEGQYRAALLLGGRLAYVRDRIVTMVRNYVRGANFEKIYVLTGDRPLNPEFESAEAIQKPGLLHFKENWRLKKMPRNETELIRTLVDQSVLPCKWQFEYIHTPKQRTETNGFRPPNTGDTVMAFREQCSDLPAGEYLSVFSQPFSYMQWTVQRLLLPRYPTIGIAGHAIPGLGIERHLDALAKLLYEEVLFRKSVLTAA